jgi:hypothetical protein
MKSKKISKKLKLNKQTVANLKKGEMKDAHGGNLDPSFLIFSCRRCPTGTSPGVCC